MDGSASVEAPLGKVEIRVGEIREEAWVGVGVETVVEVTVDPGKPWWRFW